MLRCPVLAGTRLAVRVRERLTVHQKRCVSATLVASLLLGLSAPPAVAGDNLSIQREISKNLIIDNETRFLREAGRPAPTPDHLPGPGEPEAPAEAQVSHNTAALPQFGYDPAAGAILGIKYSNVNFGPENRNLDVGATWSTEGEVNGDVTLSDPHLAGSRWIGIAQFAYALTPTKQFFGLGNDYTDGHVLSTHEAHATRALFTLARRLGPHLAVGATLGYSAVSIGRGNLQDKPSTLALFPDLPGLRGGQVSPASLSVVYNTQRDLTRPYHGWNVIAKVQRVAPVLGNRFNFTRYLFDASYLFPLGTPQRVVGLRFDTEYVSGSGNDLPFFEMASLGGANSLPGYFPDRFLGQRRTFVQAEYRTLLADFDFHHLWRVRIDGAVFAGAGRVYLSHSRLPSDLDVSAVSPDADGSWRPSYGAGLRIALSEALLARVEAGFSPESHGLFYLAFGTVF